MTHDVSWETTPNEVAYGTTGIAEVKQNVRTIILTRKGTVPLDRNFGISFDFLDTPIDTIKAKIEQEIFMALHTYEPRAVFRQVFWDGDALSGRVSPRVSIEVVLNDV